MTEPKKRLTSAMLVGRMMMLEKAAALLGGKPAVAEAIGIEPRSLRAKLNADRGVRDSDLSSVADALDARAAEILRFAAKMREATA